MTPDQSYNSALRQACISNDIDEVSRLVAERPAALRAMTPFGTWLHVAADAGALEVVNWLLAHGLDPNAKGGTFNGNALNLAAREGHIAVLERLVAAGGQLDSSEPERNPLFSAIYGGHLEAVQWLVRNGVNHLVSYTGRYMANMDALAFAQERGQTEIAQYLSALRNAA